MLQLFPDLCYHIGAIRKMGGYQRVKMSRRLTEGGIVVGGGGGGWANVWRGDVGIQLSCISK